MIFSIPYRSNQNVTISSSEYNRLLQQEVQLMKYKKICERKSAELKRLRDKLYYIEKKFGVDSTSSEQDQTVLNNPINVKNNF